MNFQSDKYVIHLLWKHNGYHAWSRFTIWYYVSCSDYVVSWCSILAFKKLAFYLAILNRKSLLTNIDSVLKRKSW